MPQSLRTYIHDQHDEIAGQVFSYFWVRFYDSLPSCLVRLLGIRPEEFIIFGSTREFCGLLNDGGRGAKRHLK